MKEHYFDNLDEYINALRNRRDGEFILVKEGAEFAKDMSRELRNSLKDISLLEAAEIVQRKRFKLAQCKIEQEQIIQGLIYNPGLW